MMAWQNNIKLHGQYIVNKTITCGLDYLVFLHNKKGHEAFLVW